MFLTICRYLQQKNTNHEVSLWDTPAVSREPYLAMLLEPSSWVLPSRPAASVACSPPNGASTASSCLQLTGQRWWSEVPNSCSPSYSWVHWLPQTRPCCHLLIVLNMSCWLYAHKIHLYFLFQIIVGFCTAISWHIPVTNWAVFKNSLSFHSTHGLVKNWIPVSWILTIPNMQRLA